VVFSRFLDAGNGQWGRAMQQDLTDATNYLIANKIAIPDKVAIMGGSYGGYATLAGLTMTPDLYACGFDLVGPSSLVTMINGFPAYWKFLLSNLIRRIGADPSTPEGVKFLNSISPLYYADRIRKPILIGQGLNDPRVNVNESQQIVDALKKLKTPYTYVLFPDEGHGLSRPENLVLMAAESEHFFAKCLGSRWEPMSDEDRKKSAAVIERFPA